LPSNYVFYTAEDSNGFIWVGTDKGLCRYNGAVWEVWDIDNGLPGNYVNQILTDKHNGLWLGISEKGVFHFDCTTKKIQAVTNSKNINTIYTNNNGDLLVGFTDTLNRVYTNWIYSYTNPTDKKKTEQGHYENGEITYHDTTNNIIHQFVFGKNQPSSTSKEKHINHFLTNINNDYSNYFLKYTPEFLVNNNWVLHYNTNPQKDTLLIVTTNAPITAPIVLYDSKEILYVARPNAGLDAIKKKTNAIVHYDESDGLTNLSINQIFETKDGTILISTLGGGIFALSKLPQHRFIPNQLPLKHLQKSGNKYYGLANGSLYEFDNNSINHEIALRKDALCFYLTNDTLLVGSFEGLHYYIFKNNTAVLKSTIPLTAGISSILPFNNQWIFSTYGTGIFSTSNFITAKRYFDGFPFGNIEKTIKLKKNIAAISYEHGFFTCNENLNLLQHFTTTKGLLSNYVTTVAEFNDTLWVGGKFGITVIANDKVVKTYNHNNGFKGKIVRCIFKDATNTMQIVSDRYLHSVQQNGNLRAYGGNTTTADKTDIVIDALYNAGDSNLVLSTQKNVSINSTGTLLPAAQVQDAYFSAIEIDGKPIDIYESFEVDYDNSSVVFKFKPASNILFSQSQILYKLNDNEWLPATDSLTVAFKNLRPGKYTLYAKVINEDGFETQPKTMITFTVNKPWWQQWWFIVLSVASVLFGSWQISKYVNKQKYLTKIKQQQQLEDERQRISRDLHDNMGAYTSALIANVQQLKGTIGENEHTQKMQTNAESILNSLRETIWVLNNKEVSLQEFNDGFKNYCFKVLKNFEHIRFDADEDIGNNPTLTASTAIHLNKIMQEAIQNIIKHANASQINYTIADKNGIEIKIEDNGVGFTINHSKTGNGMGNMQWRAKEAGLTIDVISTPNKGTTVQINTLK
jgi:signal transduction histidine kinase